MSEEHTTEQKALMARWLVMSDVAMQDSQYEGVSEHTRCCAAFDAGYVCALYLLGPNALRLAYDHPSERVLRAAAEVAHIDVEPGLRHLDRHLWDPVGMPELSEMLRWAHSMRALVPAERA